jgi:hypothetical protein
MCWTGAAVAVNDALSGAADTHTRNAGEPSKLSLLSSKCPTHDLQDKVTCSYAELSGAFKASLEGLARTVQDLHTIIKCDCTCSSSSSRR